MVYRIKWYLISFIPKSTKIISPAMQISLTNKSNTPSTMAGSSECHFFVIIGMRNLTNGFIIAHLVRDKRGDSNAIPSHIAVWGIHRIHIFFYLVSIGMLGFELIPLFCMISPWSEIIHPKKSIIYESDNW